MKTASRERAMRSLLAVFLQSDLSIAEIRAILDELESSNFALNFGNALKEVLEIIASEKHPRSTGDYSPHARAEASRFLIQRRKLPKRDVIERMMAVAPTFKPDGGLPIGPLLHQFYSQVDRNAGERFHGLLTGYVGEDPYLRGIMKKR